jgi:hypothetical protein
VKHAIIILALVLAVVLFAGVRTAAQDQATVTIKSSEVASGVVILNVGQPNTPDTAKASFELHCNKGASACKAPEPGTYLMVRLPKNWGMYDCSNVDLYPASADPATSQKIGEYCLIQK